MSIRTIEQKITAASDFDGAAPVGAATLAYDMERYATGVVGGLFHFGNTGPVEIKQVFITFGGQSAWSLSLVDVDAVETVLMDGTTETYLDRADSAITLDGMLLLEGQQLKLVTTGATTAMVARVSVNPNPR